jgi:hypothetical protein
MELGLRIPSMSSSGSDAPRAICATITMIEAGRFCLEVAQQLHAVEKAIAEAKQTLIHDLSITASRQRSIRVNGDSGRPSRSSGLSHATCKRPEDPRDGSHGTLLARFRRETTEHSADRGRDHDRGKPKD